MFERGEIRITPSDVLRASSELVRSFGRYLVEKATQSQYVAPESGAGAYLDRKLRQVPDPYSDCPNEVYAPEPHDVMEGWIDYDQVNVRGFRYDGEISE